MIDLLILRLFRRKVYNLLVHSIKQLHIRLKAAEVFYSSGTENDNSKLILRIELLNIALRYECEIVDYIIKNHCDVCLKIYIPELGSLTILEAHRLLIRKILKLGYHVKIGREIKTIIERPLNSNSYALQ